MIHDYYRCDGTEATTQALLGSLITRPKLSDKLLSKPPFRFLYDIVVEVTKNTGFAAGLYTPEELENVNDKTQKVNFLEKIIKLVGVQLNTLVEAKPVRIVAGYDPQQTNNFLQLLAVAATHVPDSRYAHTHTSYYTIH
jgi:TRAF3-interacting protein 1